jgi:hypothetical protein
MFVGIGNPYGRGSDPQVQELTCFRQRFYGRPTHVNLSPFVLGRPIDRSRPNFRLKNRRHRLSFVMQTALDPAKLAVWSAGICTIVNLTLLLA